MLNLLQVSPDIVRARLIPAATWGSHLLFTVAQDLARGGAQSQECFVQDKEDGQFLATWRDQPPQVTASCANVYALEKICLLAFEFVCPCVRTGVHACVRALSRAFVPACALFACL